MSRTRSTVYLSAARIVGILVQVVSVPIVWDVLGAVDFGVCLFLVSLARWVGLIDVGFLDGCQRQMTKAFDDGDEDKGFSVWNTYRATLALSSVLGFIVILGLQLVVRLPSSNPEYNVFLFASAGAMFASQFVYGGAIVYFNARRQFSRLSVSNGVQNLMSGLLALWFVLLTKHPAAYMLGFVVGNGAVAAFNLYTIWMDSRASSPSRFYKDAFSEALHFGLRLYPTRVATVVSQTFDRILVTGALGPASLARYGSAARIPEAGSEALPLNQTLMPDLTKAHSEGPAKFSAEVDRLSRVALMVGCGLIFIPCAFADPLLRAWLGEKYVPEMAWVMLAIGLYRALETFYSSLAVSMIAHGSPGRLAPFTIYGAVMVLALLYPVSMSYGIIGVAVVRVAVHISQFAPLMAYTRAHVAREIDLSRWISRSSGIVVVSLFFCVAAQLLVRLRFVESSPWLALAFVPLLSAVFFVMTDWLDLARVPDSLRRRFSWAFRAQRPSSSL